jgi:hypothetical protein
MNLPISLGASLARRRLVVGLAALVVAAAVLVGYAVWPSHHPRPLRHTPSPVALAPIPTMSEPTPTPTPTPTRPVRRSSHEYVRAAVPTSFTLTGRRFTINAHVCQMPNVRPYDPPGEQHHTVCWVKSGFGVRPSSRQPATTYLFGHSWAPDPLEVLNKASAVATEEILRVRPHTVDGVPVYPVRGLVGYRLILRTSAGTLTYRVRSAWGVRKDQLGFITSYLDPKVPNRVLLTTCAELRGSDYDYNVIIDAGLQSSRRR